MSPMARELGRWSLVAALAALALGIGTAGGATTQSSSRSLVVQVIGRGSVTSGGGQISCGNGAKHCYFETSSSATIVLTAEPAAGWMFDHWEGDDCSGTSTSCTVTLNADDHDENTAYFTQVGSGTNTLTVNVTGDDNSGNV